MPLTDSHPVSDEDPSADEKTSHHLLIAGTGRAGTSFLVRYLTGFGLDTHLTRVGDATSWSDRANAGLEDWPRTDMIDLPYVIKSPWTYQLIDDLLGSRRIVLDTVIIPLRNLVEAASSRVVIDFQSLHDSCEWLSDVQRTWEDWGHVPGGIVYSLNPMDQARLLAVGFHHLLERLVAAEIPIIFLSFPRMARDPDYLFHALSRVLPSDTTVEKARELHATIADAAKVRVTEELAEYGPASARSIKGPSPRDLERVALSRELKRLRGEAGRAAELERENAACRQALLEAQAQRDAAVERAARSETESAEVLARLQIVQAEAATAVAARDRALFDLTAAREAGDTQIEMLRAELQAEVTMREDLQEFVNATRRSRTWQAAMLARRLPNLLLDVIVRRAPTSSG